MNKTIKVIKCSLLLSICTFSLTTCSQDKQKLIDQATLTQVMSELMTIENMAIADSTKARMIYKSLQKNKISLEKLRSSIEASAKNPEYWQMIYESVKEKLSANPNTIE